MPPIRTSRNRKPPPAGFDDIEDTLLEFSNKMKDAENAPHEGKKKHEVLWPIFQITHQRQYESKSTYTIQSSSPLNLPEIYQYRLKIHLRPLLPERGDIETAIRMALEKRVRGCELDCEVEEARVREGKFFAVIPRHNIYEA
jgi:hypothetical protein